MMMRLLCLLFMLLAFIQVNAAALSGQVIDARTRTPLQDVTIQLKWYGGSHRLQHATDAEGRFEIQLSQILPAEALERRSLNLLFERQDYVTENLLLEQQKGETFTLERRLITLAPIAGAQERVSTAYNTLYILPYQVARGSGLADAKEMQALITEYLVSGIDMYLQEIGQPAPIDRFGLQKLATDTPLEISDTAGVISYGQQLQDALAIVGGRAGTRMTEDRREQMEFSSRYVIVPEIKDSRVRVRRLNDALPTGLISSRAIADRLNLLWGRNTVLAIGIAALQSAIVAEEETKQKLLGLAEDFLQAELKDAGADEPLVAELNDLLQQVREAQTP